MIQTVAWTFAGAAVGLTIGRYAIRIRMLKGLRWDDLFHGLAVIALIAYLVVYTFEIPEAHSASLHVEGVDPDPSTAEVEYLFRLKVASTILLWVVFYLIKLSFLMFYRQIFEISTSFRRAWWAVIAFTLLTFLIGFLAIFWMCGAPTELFHVG